MRLDRTLNRRDGDRVYHKWRINDLPARTVEALGWSEGDELEAVVRSGALVVRRVSRPEARVRRRVRSVVG